MGDKSIYSTSTKVHLLWDSFINSKSNSYERGAWLDLFLAEVILQIHDGKPPSEVLSFGSLSGSRWERKQYYRQDSNENQRSKNGSAVLEGVAGEAVSEIEALFSDPLGDDLHPLRKYLLSGRGWMFIALLHALPLKDVRCGQELASLLMSAYSVVEGDKTDSNQYVVTRLHPNDIDELCKFKLSPKVKYRSLSQSSEPSSPALPSRKISSSSYRYKAEFCEESSDGEEVHKSVGTLKIRLDPMDFDYFTTIVRSEDERPSLQHCQENFNLQSLSLPRKKPKKLIPDDLKDERSRSLLKNGLSGGRFKILVVEILESLAEGCLPPQICVLALNFALENLCSLQFSESSSGGIEELRMAHTRLLLVALEKVLTNEESLSMALRKGVLAVTLRLLEDALSKARHPSAFIRDFIYALNYAVINLIHLLLLVNGTGEKLENFLGLFQQFITSYNGRVVDKSVGVIMSLKELDYKTSLSRVKKIICLVSQLILSLKQARAKLTHFGLCAKQKHKNCKYSTVSHHHEDSFGTVWVKSGLGKERCCLSSLLMILTRLIEVERDVSVASIQAIRASGTCCCFPVSVLVSQVLRVIHGADSKLRQIGLALLENTVYKELGAIDQPLPPQCNFCFQSDTLSKNRWVCMEAFQEMLLSNNKRVAQAVATHLMRVTPECSLEFQSEILFSVFYPVLTESVKKNKGSPPENKFLTEVCLCVLRHLAGRKRLAEQLGRKEGFLELLLDIISVTDFTKHACYLLQTLTLIKLWELDTVPEEGIKELQALFNLLEETTKKFISLIKKLQRDLKGDVQVVFRSVSELESYLNVTEQLSIYWKCCMELCLYSPQVRSYSMRHLSIFSYTLLNVLLQHLASPNRIEGHLKEDYQEKLSNSIQLQLKLLEALVVLSVITPYSGNPGGVFDLKAKLEKVVEGKVGLRSVCDCILRSSGANPSKFILLPTLPMPKLTSLEYGLSSVTEEGNTDSSLSTSADEGYDADVEVQCRKRKEENKNSLPASRKISSVGERRFYKIVHPSLCHLVLHLIVHCNKRDILRKDCVYSINKLCSLVRDLPENCVALAESDFTKKLLIDFKEVLSKRSNQLQELQQGVLELFGYLAKHRLEAEELSLYISFFISEESPIDLLVGGLLKLVKGLSPQPKFRLRFPAKYYNANLINSSPAHKLAIQMHHQHLSLGMNSSWTRGSIFMPINADLGWSMWVQGFSIALWIKLDPSLPLDSPINYVRSSVSSESGKTVAEEKISIENLLHVVSIGYEDLLLEFWVQSATESLHVRLTQPEGKSQEVLSEASFDLRLPMGLWHQLSISVKDSINNGKIFIDVKLIADGWRESRVTMEPKGLLVRKNRPVCLILGDTQQLSECGVDPGRSYEISSLFVLRGPYLEDSRLAAHLTCQSPMHYTLVQPSMGNNSIPEASHLLFSYYTLAAGIPWYELVNKEPNLNLIQDNLLLGYSAITPDIISIYPQVASNSAFRLSGEQKNSQLVSTTVQNVTLSNLANESSSTFITALHTLGSLPVILFLFARVVELKGNESEQADALELLLTLSLIDLEFKSQLGKYIHLIETVIETSHCQPGQLMLKAILEVCCERGRGGETVVRDAGSLVGLVLGSACHGWLGGSQSTPSGPAPLATFLDTLLAMLRDDHPYREFNAHQLNSAQTIPALIHFTKERLVERGCRLSIELSQSLVEVVRALMTAPPRLDHLTHIADYLLLSHPAHYTFITHSRDNLYFLLAPHPPVKPLSKAAQLKLGLFGKSAVETDRDFRGVYTQPIDPGKLNKALANLQMKERVEHLESGREEVFCDSGISGSYRANSDTLNAQESDDVSSGNTNQLDFEDDSTPDNESVSSDELLNVKQLNNEVPEVDGDDVIRTGLLELLRDEILVSPDSVTNCLLPSIISPENLIVMANHNNSSTVTAVVKVLSAYWERANAEERQRLIREKIFILLGLQLSNAVVSPELAEMLSSLVTGSYRLTLPQSLDTSDCNLHALPPILSILNNAVSDVPLAHSIISFLHAMFIKIGDWKNLLDCGLIEGVLKSLITLSHENHPVSGRILISDIHSLLATIVSQALQSTLSNSIQVVLEVLQLLEYIVRMEVNSCGQMSGCSLILRHTHATILHSSLTCVLQLIATHSTKPSFLSSMMTMSSDDGDSSTSLNQLNNFSKLSRSDLNERFKIVIGKAVEFAIHTEPGEFGTGYGVNCDYEEEFVRDVWSHLVNGLITVIERKSISTRTTWSNVVWANRDTLRGLGTQMFVWLMSPGHSKKLRMQTIQSILNEPRSKDFLVYILPTSQVEEVVGLFLWELKNRVEVSVDDVKVVEELCSRLEEWCIPSVFSIITSTNYSYSQQLNSALNHTAYLRTNSRKQHNSSINKLVYRYEGLGEEVLSRGLNVMKKVVDKQSKQRKLLMSSVKTGYATKVEALFSWARLIQFLSHERAVWHFPSSYPRCWELDPTEGPARVRNRLQRCHLNMDNKFIKPDYAYKLKGNSKEPLSYLFEGRGSMSGVLIDRLHSETKIRHMCQATLITPAHQLPGELLVGHCALYFVPSSQLSHFVVSDVNEVVSQEWPFDEIKELHRRRYELQERAIEIFLINGKTHLIAFQSTKERDDLMVALISCELGSRVASEPLCDAVELWRDGLLTNWQYLSTLNTFAGRSYNDLMQYPVLPFVLADYTSQVLDLDDPKSYRNFKKPMAIQDKKNEQHYINNYNYLKTELSEGGTVTHSHEPYHYSSHYSNSGTVLHFLVRLPPFTSMFLAYQDHNFDWPDRTFHSLHTTWRLTSSESTTDVKELIPEFFFLPEFLTNYEGFNFGMRQNGEPVDNVLLPPWARDPRTFILVHRQALESEYVRENLPSWIDLVFGFKQVGKPAVESINVFHPATYNGFDPESIADPLVRIAWQTMVRTYGQTPKQLFRSPHPMVEQCLQAKISQPQVIPGVKGLSWGHYVGSPGDPPAQVVSRHSHHTLVSSLVTLLTNDVFGLAPKTCLLLAYTKETPLNLVLNGGTCVLGAALVSWGHGDSVVRVKLRKEQAPFPAVLPTPHHTITLCTSAPDTNQLWVAYSSGKIVVYSYKFDRGGGKLEFSEESVELCGHTQVVLSISVSRNFSLALSTSEDGTAIIWDINTLSYVRSLPHIAFPVVMSCISDTLGDLVTVGSDGETSSVRLHSINALLIGNIATQLRVTAITCSTAPEGTSVNVIAAALADFTIQLWSIWDLSPVGVITAPAIHHPFICLSYSADSQQLYGSTEGGVVYVWESNPTSRHPSKSPKFLNLTSLL